MRAEEEGKNTSVSSPRDRRVRQQCCAGVPVEPAWEPRAAELPPGTAGWGLLRRGAEGSAHRRGCGDVHPRMQCTLEKFSVGGRSF